VTNSPSFQSQHLAEDLGRSCVLSAVEVSADAEKIWAEIDQFDQWDTWNPLYVESTGTLGEGNTLQFSVAIPGMSPQQGKAVVAELQPGEFVRYEIKTMGGLVKGTRFIEVQQLSPGRCLVANGEIMGGALGPILCRFMGERVRQGLENMNVALKARLENEQGE